MLPSAALARRLAPEKKELDNVRGRYHHGRMNRAKDEDKAWNRPLSNNRSNISPDKSVSEALQRGAIEAGIFKRVSPKELGLLLLQWLVAAVNQEAGPALEPLRRIFSGLADERIKPLWQPVMDALRLGPVDRLGRCPVCRKFFLRSRKDQPACSKACANNLRVRRWRERYQDRYKPQRLDRADASEPASPIAKKGGKLR